MTTPPAGDVPAGAPRRLSLSPTVIALGAVSLFTDASSEMIYPLLPLLLTGALGAGVASVGLIEGAAEGVASLLKLVSGSLSDRLPRRKPLVVFGYGLSALLRPLLGLAQGPLAVLAIRLGDRLGKGVRSGPRDALLADATPPALRGRAFGLHRAMDNAGAVVGPLVAYLLLGAGLGLRQVFLWAAVPGAVAVLVLVTRVGEARRDLSPPSPSGRGAGGEGRAGTAIVPLPAELKRYLVALAVFSLGNSADAFLLLWARDTGVPAAQVPLLWMAHNAVKAVLSTPFGALSDRLGRRRMILLGWVLYALVYAGCATLRGPFAAWALLGAYGVYYSLLEGAEKALVADLAPPGLRGRAFGWFHGVVGVCALPASLIFAFLYQSGGPKGGSLRAFSLGAALAGAAALLLLRVPDHRPDMRGPARA